MTASQSIVSPSEAVMLLRSGFVVAIPTETVYGLAGSLALPDAIQKIFETKKRPLFDPLIVHIPKHFELWQSLVNELPPTALALAEAFWPGPLTIVLPKSPKVPSLVTANQTTVAVRCPNHPITLSILEQVGPVCAPSANPFGRTSPVTPKHVIDYFDGQVPVVDGGPCSIGIESTILLISNHGKSLTILRKGMIFQSEIESVLTKQKIPFQWENNVSQTLLPGMLPHHYQPFSPLTIYLVDPTKNKIIAEPANVTLPLDDPFVCARFLYSTLIENSQKYSNLVLHWPITHRQGHWEPIWEKLQKAASRIID